MRKLIFALFSISLLFASLGIASAHHTTFELSDSLTFREDISGSDRGFFLKQSTDVPRLTKYGYYDWSYRPDPHKLAYYPDDSKYKLSQNTVNQAFSTFQRDSQSQFRLEEKHLELHYRPYSGYYGGYRYHGRVSYPTVYRYGF